MKQNLQAFPFNTGKPLRNGDPFLGGEIFIIPAGAANANASFAHHLRQLPRAFIVLDVSTNAPVPTPFPHGTTAWSHSAFTLALPALTAAVTGVLI